jgi:hypothetical protein
MLVTAYALNDDGMMIIIRTRATENCDGGTWGFIQWTVRRTPPLQPFSGSRELIW